MKRILVLCVAGAALAFAGCGGGSSSSTDTSSSGSSSQSGSGGGATAPSGKGTVVDMKNIQFAPETTTVKVGQTVKWENLDTVDHNVTATSGASFKSDDFGHGGTYTFKATKPGTIDYTCTLHPGMDGKLVVTQ